MNAVFVFLVSLALLTFAMLAVFIVVSKIQMHRYLKNKKR